MEPIGLLLSSQDHATDPDIEVHEFSPQPHSLFLKIRLSFVLHRMSQVPLLIYCEILNFI